MNGAMTMDELRDALGDIREFMGRHDAKLEDIKEKLAQQNGRVAKLEDAHAMIRERVSEARGAWRAISAVSALIGGGVAWAAKHFLPVLLAVCAYGQTATISDTLTASVGGGAWTGRIVVTLSAPGSSQPLYSGSTSLAGWSQTLCLGVTGSDCSSQVSAGVVAITLYTNSAITPSGTSYAARFTPTRGTGWNEVWTVSAGDTKLLDIRATTVPSPTVTFSPSQLTPGSNGQCITTASGIAAWGTCAAGGTGISSLNSQTGATQTFANDTNVTMVSATDTHTLTWAGQLAVTRGGTGASSASAARTSLGLAIGTDVQAYDADLAAVAGLSTTGLIERTGSGTAGTVAAASTNTASAIVQRDGSGNFAAGTITAALTGNASTATALQTARNIAGVSFDGTANISIPSTGLSDTANLVRNNAGNTWSTGAQDFGAATSLKMPVAAGATTATNGFLAYDSTAHMIHAAQSSADAFIPQATITPSDNDCVKWVVSGSQYKLGSAGAACGSGGGSSSTPYDAAVTAQTTVTVAASTHGQGTTPAAFCFEGSAPYTAAACSYTRASNGDIVFTWSPAFTGRITIMSGGGSGTVTDVSVVTANGVSGSVANSTTTPAITLTLGAITPTSVAASGNVTGANLSGTNTGDQTTITGNAGTATALAANPTDCAANNFATTIAANGNLTCAQPSISAGVSGLGTNVAAFLGTPSSSNLIAALTDETGTGAAVFGTSPTITTPTISGAIALPDGVRQTFNPDGTNAGLNVGSQAGDPSAPSNGDLWYDSTANELTARINGANVALGAGGGGGMADPGANGVVVRTALNTTTARTITGTASQITVADGDGVSANPTISLATRTFRVSLLSGQTMPDTSGSVFMEPYTIKATNDFWGYNVWVFNDTSTDLKLYTVIETPENFVSGAKACVVWTSTATSGNVVWGAPYRVVSGDDTNSIDQSTAGTTPTAATDAAPTAAQRRLRTCITLTDSDFSSLGTLQLNFQRNGTSGSDTMAAAAMVHALEFEYQGR